MNKFWHRIELFLTFRSFGLSTKEAWEDAKEVAYARTRSKRA